MEVVELPPKLVCGFSASVISLLEYTCGHLPWNLTCSKSEFDVTLGYNVIRRIQGFQKYRRYQLNGTGTGTCLVPPVPVLMIGTIHSLVTRYPYRYMRLSTVGTGT